MKAKFMHFLKSRTVQFYPRLSTSLSEETRLKKMLDEHHIIDSKLPEAPSTKTPPEAIQGMWEAYGTIYAAKTRGWFDIAAAGVIGTGLVLYSLILSDQKKELKIIQEELTRLQEKNKAFEREIKENEEQFQVREKSVIKSSDYIRKDVERLREDYKRMEKNMQAADSYISKLCDNNEECLNKYVRIKGKAERIFKMIDDYNTKYPKPSTDTTATTVSNSKK